MVGFDILCIVALLSFIFYLYMDSKCVKIYRFYSPNCIHCKNSKLEWDDFKKKTMFNLVKPIDIDLSDENNKDLANNFTIQSVPTIYKVYPDGRRILFENERNIKNYMSFILE